MSFCCSRLPKGKDTSFFRILCDSVEKGVAEWKEKTSKLTDLHRHGIAGPCEGCRDLHYDYFPIKTENPQWVSVRTNSTFKGDLCNVKCIYCVATKIPVMQSTHDLKDAVINVTKFFNDKMIRFSFANAEFLARLDADDVLEYLAPLNVNVQIASNGTIYRESLAKLIQLKKLEGIITNLDCGTKETFFKIKGRDLFEQTVSNLEKLSNSGAHIDVNYILLPGINDDDANIDGFIDIVAKRIKSKSIGILSDQRKLHERLPEYTLGKVVALHDKAKQIKMPVRMRYECFNAEDAKVLREKINKQ